MSTSYIIKNEHKWWLYTNIMECKIILKWDMKTEQELGTMARLHSMLGTIVNKIIIVIKQIKQQDKDNLTNNECDSHISYYHENTRLQA